MTELTGSGAITEEYLAEVERLAPILEKRLRDSDAAKKKQMEAMLLLSKQNPAS